MELLGTDDVVVVDEPVPIGLERAVEFKIRYGAIVLEDMNTEEGEVKPNIPEELLVTLTLVWIDLFEVSPIDDVILG
jgi:hypothetical protein